jgi:HAE1 family hydrophobic/amphiphilic exporter-1
VPSFSLRNPYTIIVGALVVLILGVTAFTRMPVDIFPDIKIPAVVVATFYQGMPPLDMEDNITFRYERFSHWVATSTISNRARSRGLA